MTLKDFWLALTLTCLAWYTFVTTYVAWKGIGDIRQMLRRLRAERIPDGEAPR